MIIIFIYYNIKDAITYIKIAWILDKYTHTHTHYNNKKYDQK